LPASPVAVVLPLPAAMVSSPAPPVMVVSLVMPASTVIVSAPPCPLI
jgi:hypothetical protein